MCSKGYSTWSVCLLLNISLFMLLFVSQMILTFSVVDEGQKILSDFLWKCFIVKLECFLLVQLHDKLRFFTPQKTRMRMNLDHVPSSHFVLGRDVLCELDYWPLAASMPPTKVCLQCKAVVPVRRIVSCQVYFLHAVILSFDPNKKHSAICEKNNNNNETYGSSRIR